MFNDDYILGTSSKQLIWIKSVIELKSELFLITFMLPSWGHCFLSHYSPAEHLFPQWLSLSHQPVRLTWCSWRRKRRREIPIFLLNTSCLVTHRHKHFLIQHQLQEVIVDSGGGKALMPQNTLIERCNKGRDEGSAGFIDWWVKLDYRSLTCLLIWALWKRMWMR